MNQDIRWQQRLDNYSNALSQLKRFVEEKSLNELEEQGIIKAFEYTYELGWNVMKDFLEYKGNQNIFGSRDAIQEAFKLGLIENGEGWMMMFKDRNKTSHTYNKETAREVIHNIRTKYSELFFCFESRMKVLKEES